MLFIIRLQVSYDNDVATDAVVTLFTDSILQERNISRGICAIRGTVDTDKFLIVGKFNTD